MPRWSSALNTRIEEYGRQLRDRRRDPQTIREYSRLIRQAFEALREAGLECTPQNVGEEEVYYLHNEQYGHLLPMTARNQLAIVGTFLKRNGNPVVENMGIEWPADERVHAKWLEPAQAKRLKNAAVGMERMLVHCELDLCMRRCEVLRLRPSDFRGVQVDILGKGRLGGKPRSVPYHPKTTAELSYYWGLREEMVGRVLRRDPAAKVPDALIIWERWGRRVDACAESTVDRMLKRCAERAGLPPEAVSNHVLRRTGARIQWLAGTPIGAISKTLGHVSEEQTVRYLGIRLDDMAKGMRAADAFMEGLVPEQGT